MVPGEKFSTTTSAQSISGSSTSRLAGASCRARGSAWRCSGARTRACRRSCPAREAADLHVDARQARPRARFDLDHLAAEVAEHLGGDRADERPGEVEHPDAGERSARASAALRHDSGAAGAAVAGPAVTHDEARRRANAGLRPFARSRAPPGADRPARRRARRRTVALMPRRRPSPVDLRARARAEEALDRGFPARARLGIERRAVVAQPVDAAQRIVEGPPRPSSR